MDYMEGYTIRFADDILVFSRSVSMAKMYLEKLKEFASERGLKLSDKKTTITSVYDGFEFLSRHYYKINDIIYCEPSSNAVKKMENDLYDIILNHKTRWSQKRLIDTINSKLNGWATYHKVENSTEAFKHIDLVVSGLLLNLMKEMHPKLPIKTIIKKYWYKDVKEREVFALTTNKNIRVIKLEDVILVDHKCIDYTRNVFLDKEYFEERSSIREIQNVSGKYKAIWERQDGKCFYCGKPINKNQNRTLIQKDLSKRSSNLKNLAYVHSFCTEDEMIYINSNGCFANNTDFQEVIREIKDVDIVKIFTKDSKYAKLYEYFAKCTKYTFTLTFKELENIIGQKLCNSLYNYESYWKMKGKGVISNCWLSNGYLLKRIYLKEKKVTFIREKKQSSMVEIPEQILSSNISKNAKHEIEQFFEYIIKKYGL
jgi:hypothetical protein